MDTSTYDLSVKKMLPNHYCVDGLRIFECKERKAPRTASGVPHDRAGFDLAKLREILPE